MQPHSPRLLIGSFAATVAVLGLVGCGSENDTQNGDTDTATATGDNGGQIEVGNTINYGSFGTTTDLDCEDGKSLNIGGSNNTLTVRGTCDSVTVGGTDNVITLERVESDIRIVGMNNTLTYSDGEPNVDDTGQGNEINRG